jgi:DtxR family Mn-dependent transcriptional regulator
MDEHTIEEALELLWIEHEGKAGLEPSGVGELEDEERLEPGRVEERENGGRVENHRIDRAEAPAPADVIGELERRGLAARRAGRVELLPPGAELASLFVRRGRLADALEAAMKSEEKKTDPKSGAFRDTLDRDIVDRVCTFLGHPGFCPEGRVIPGGRCCNIAKTAGRPLVFPLVELEPETGATIVFINPRSEGRVEKLASLGVVPGSPVRLLQRRPSLILETGQGTAALDAEIGREVYVRES